MHILLVDFTNILRVISQVNPIAEIEDFEAHCYSIITRVVESQNPSHVLIAVDDYYKSSRSDRVPSYQPPSSFLEHWMIDSAMRIVQRLSDQAGFRTLVRDGLESKDLIASVCEALKSRKDYRITILGKSQRLYSLLESDNITLKNPFKNTRHESIQTGLDLIRKFELSAKEWDLYLTLKGIPSSGLKGIKGIGAANSACIAKEYQNVTRLIAEVDSIDGKNGERVRSQVQDLPLLFMASSLNRKVTLGINLKSMRI